MSIKRRAEPPATEGYRKDRREVFVEAEARGILEPIKRVAKKYHLTALEVCELGSRKPGTRARAEVWAWLVTPLPEGAGWSYERVAEVWGGSASGVSQAVKLYGETAHKRFGPDGQELP